MTTQAERDGGEAPVAEQTEELLGSLGERFGRLIASATRSVRGFTDGAATATERPAIERAEVLVNRIEGSVAGLAAAASYSARRIAARAREEAEDIRAEAEMKRHDGVEPATETE